MKINKKGVSLPELLAVIVIMGLIAIIVIPGFTSTITTTRRKTQLSELRTFVAKIESQIKIEGITDVSDMDDNFWDDIKTDYNGAMPFEVDGEYSDWVRQVNPGAGSYFWPYEFKKNGQTVLREDDGEHGCRFIRHMIIEDLDYIDLECIVI